MQLHATGFPGSIDYGFSDLFSNLYSYVCPFITPLTVPTNSPTPPPITEKYSVTNPFHSEFGDSSTDPIKNPTPPPARSPIPPPSSVPTIRFLKRSS